jgi:CDP-paratose synthetase
LLRFLLTGATGYLGRHLLQAMSCAGYDVVIAARNACRCTTRSSSFEHINLSSQELGSILAEKQIDAIIHTATCYGRNGESLSQICEANLTLPLRLLDAASEAGVPTFVNADTVLPPEINQYSRSKAQFREWGKEYVSNRKKRFINFKIDHMYGPAEDPTKFVTRMAQLCLTQANPIELTEGHQRRDFIHVTDVVSAYLTVLKKYKTLPFGFIEFEIGSGSSAEIRTLVETIHKLTASSAELRFGAVPYRAFEVMNSQLDSSTLRQLGWSPRVRLEDGLRELIAFEREKCQ